MSDEINKLKENNLKRSLIVNKGISELKERIEELEKKFENNNTYNLALEADANTNKNEKDIAELRKDIKAWVDGQRIGAKQLNELKEEQEAFIEVCQIPCKDCKLNVIKEVLRDMLETKKQNSEKHLAELVDDPLIEIRFIKACEKQIEDAKRQLEKLDAPKTEKKEVPADMADLDELEKRSKPPKPPLYKCLECGTITNSLAFAQDICGRNVCPKCGNEAFTIPEDRLSGGTGKEPRENDDIHDYFMNHPDDLPRIKYQRFILEIIGKLEKKWEYLTKNMYETLFDPNFEEETEKVFKDLIEEYEAMLK